MFACILLAAGASQRFGSPKTLAKIAEVTVIEHLQKNLLSAAIDEIIIVLGAHRDEIKPHILNHKRIKVVYNKDYKFGQTSSFQCGLKAMSSDMKGVFLLPADFPLVRPETLTALKNIFLQNNSCIIIPRYQSRKGHPPLFSRNLLTEFLTLPPESGLNTIAQQHAQETLFWDGNDDGVVLTFNTLEEFQVLQRKFSERNKFKVA